MPAQTPRARMAASRSEKEWGGRNGTTRRRTKPRRREKQGVKRGLCARRSSLRFQSVAHRILQAHHGDRCLIDWRRAHPLEPGGGRVLFPAGGASAALQSCLSLSLFGLPDGKAWAQVELTISASRFMHEVAVPEPRLASFDQEGCSDSHAGELARVQLEWGILEICGGRIKLSSTAAYRFAAHSEEDPEELEQYCPSSFRLQCQTCVVSTMNPQAGDETAPTSVNISSWPPVLHNELLIDMSVPWGKYRIQREQTPLLGLPSSTSKERGKPDSVFALRQGGKWGSTSDSSKPKTTGCVDLKAGAGPLQCVASKLE
ncbi:hypothetical protein BDW22DRAFT_1343581 [Trametopsis cervina]|nr:hypothetical protein BDW22DRAFT_1343581 [Trametopsis cervina]